MDMSGEEQVALALEDTLGPALILDTALRIVGSTPGAEQIIGPFRKGVLAVSVLCGDSQQRPVADALARGKAVSAEIPRPHPDGTLRILRIRASPMVRDGQVRGFLLLLNEEEDPSAPDAAVERWGMYTRSPLMKRLFRDIERVARRKVTVLVRGESGTGKELAARAIHDASPRSSGPFRAINCAALPPHLLESELFGHVRGAFTGAVRDNPGHFRIADGGTLFLDEIVEMPLELQAKLLRVLQEKIIVPVGGREAIPVDVRIISATHQSLRAAVKHGRFREDLMYRVRVVPLHLPPLRDRDGDVELLAMHFLAGLNDDQRHVSKISSGALSLLESYDWPGNVRELANAMEYAFAMGDGPVIVEADLPTDLSGAADVPVANVPPAADENLSPEQSRLLRAVERAGGHRGRAAAMLGMSRSTLWRRLKEIEEAQEEQQA